MPSWFDDKSKEICTAKSRLLYDVLTPAASADCVHVPHIGELNKRFLEVCSINYEINSYIYKMPINWQQDKSRCEEFISMRKIQEQAINRYKKINGRLVR